MIASAEIIDVQLNGVLLNLYNLSSSFFREKFNNSLNYRDQDLGTEWYHCIQILDDQLLRVCRYTGIWSASIVCDALVNPPSVVDADMRVLIFCIVPRHGGNSILKTFVIKRLYSGYELKLIGRSGAMFDVNPREGIAWGISGGEF